MMRILDLRPRSVRFMSSLWSSGKHIRGFLPADPGPGHLLGRLAGRVADGLAARRVAGRSRKSGGPFLVSVGNLALGGTGKTPVVTALAVDLAAQGIKGAILTRGFGSPLAGPLAVSPDNILAGDEARMMAAALVPVGWPVVQAKRRHLGLDFLRQEHPGIEVVIVEDGHQTAGIGRDLDVVILDAWTLVSHGGPNHVKPVTGPVFPFGPWRESAAGAERAGVWLLETDSVSLPNGQQGQSVATFQRHLTLRTPDGKDSGDLGGSRPAVLSGIARPEAFEASLENVLPAAPVLAVRCGDHARYAPRMVDEITGAAAESEADFFVTTSKDWVKLKPFWPDSWRVLVAELEIRWGQGRTLPELVAESLRS